MNNQIPYNSSALPPPSTSKVYFISNRGFPLFVSPLSDNVSLADWAMQNKVFLEKILLQIGAIVFRGFKIESNEDFEKVMVATSGNSWVEYREASTPRSHVSGNVFTSTEYPPSQQIFLHQENSHCTSWPAKLYFYCKIPAVEGGETSIANCRRISARLTPEIRDAFMEKGWMYVRNFGRGFGFDWRKVFNAVTKEELETYCEKNLMTLQWKSEDELKISYQRTAFIRHPKTSETLWFNHGLLFHPTALSEAVRRGLSTLFKMEDFPYYTCYGDGTPVEDEVLGALRKLYSEETILFPWEAEDVMLIDNMLTAHGRQPYSGDRRILVGMRDQILRTQVEL